MSSATGQWKHRRRHEENTGAEERETKGARAGLVGWNAVHSPNLKDDLKRLAEIVPQIDKQTVGNLGLRTSQPSMHIEITYPRPPRPSPTCL